MRLSPSAWRCSLSRRRFSQAGDTTCVGRVGVGAAVGGPRFLILLPPRRPMWRLLNCTPPWLRTRGRTLECGAHFAASQSWHIARALRRGRRAPLTRSRRNFKDLVELGFVKSGLSATNPVWTEMTAETALKVVDGLTRIADMPRAPEPATAAQHWSSVTPSDLHTAQRHDRHPHQRWRSLAAPRTGCPRRRTPRPQGPHRPKTGRTPTRARRQRACSEHANHTFEPRRPC